MTWESAIYARIASRIGSEGAYSHIRTMGMNETPQRIGVRMAVGLSERHRVVLLIQRVNHEWELP